MRKLSYEINNNRQTVKYKGGFDVLLYIISLVEEH